MDRPYFGSFINSSVFFLYLIFEITRSFLHVKALRISIKQLKPKMHSSLSWLFCVCLFLQEAMDSQFEASTSGNLCLGASGCTSALGPEQKHFQLVRKSSSIGSGSAVKKCLYCAHEFFGGALRMRCHLLGLKGYGVSACSATLDTCVIEEMKKVHLERGQEVDNKRAKAKRKAESQALMNVQAAKFLKQNTIQTSIAKMNKAEVDQMVFRAAVSAEIPFIFFANEDVKAAFAAVAKFGTSYSVPSVPHMKSTLLEREKQIVDDRVQRLLSDIGTTSCTITSDGWTSVQKRPLLNCLAVCNKGEVFLGALDTSGATKNAEYVANYLATMIEKVGADNVIQVTTDSAAVCVAAGAILEERFSHLTWTPCAPHCLDLALEDIGKLAWVKEVVANANNIVQFITAHHLSLAFFRAKSESSCRGLQLLRPGETRFATNFICLQRLIEVRVALKELVADANWDEWLHEKSYVATGEHVAEIILDKTWWKKAEQIAAICEPFVSLLRLLDGNVGVIGKVYWRMSNLLDGVKEKANLDGSKFKQIQDIHLKRWTMMHSRLHAAGFVLDPEYRGHDQHANMEVMRDFKAVLQKLLEPNQFKHALEQWLES